MHDEDQELTFGGLPKFALFGHAAISELGLLSGIKRKVDFEPTKGSFWREADIRQDTDVG